MNTEAKFCVPKKHNFEIKIGVAINETIDVSFSLFYFAMLSKGN